MKALIIYFTSTGRTKKIARAIGEELTNYEVQYFPIELIGRFSEIVNIHNQHRNGDFSTIEEELLELEKIDQHYDLIFFGIPTYGDLPPSAFYEIVKRIDLNEQNVVLFNTCSLTGYNTLNLITKEVEESGATIVDKARFKGLFKPKIKQAIRFGKHINQNFGLDTRI